MRLPESESHSVGGSSREVSTMVRRDRAFVDWQRRIGRRVDIPLFNGSDAHGWIVRIERYFRLNEVRDDEKLELVVVALEDRALTWFQWWEEQAEEMKWEPFKEALIRRFQPGLVKNPFGPLLSVKQLGSVMEYREKFETVAAPLKITDKEMLKGIFLNGLKEEIRAELKLFHAESLSELMDQALLLEEKNFVWRKGRIMEEDRRTWKERERNAPTPVRMIAPGEISRNRILGHGTEQVNKTLVEQKAEEGSNKESRGKGERRLTQAKLQERSRKGLCFKCGEKWGREHVCKLMHYKLLLVEGEEGEEEMEWLSEEKEDQLVLEDKTLHLSLDSKEELTSNRSFKVWGKLGGRNVLILVDCGATNNFIDKKLVEQLQLQVTETPEYVV